MQWIDNNLIDDKNKYLVGYESDYHCGWASVTVHDNNGNDITEDNLTDWEFCEFPYLSTRDGEGRIAIVNKKLGVTGYVYCESSNKGDSPACYWAEKTKINELLKKEIKKSDGMQEEISSLKTEISKQKNELARNHNTIKDLQSEVKKQKDSLEWYQVRNDELANLNASLNQEIHSIKNKNDIMNKATEHVVPDSYIKLRSLTKNLLSYIDSNL